MSYFMVTGERMCHVFRREKIKRGSADYSSLRERGIKR